MRNPRDIAFQALLKSLKRNENGGNFFKPYFLTFCSYCLSTCFKRQFYFSITVITYLLPIHIVVIEKKTHNGITLSTLHADILSTSNLKFGMGRRVMSLDGPATYISALRQRIERAPNYSEDELRSTVQNAVSPFGVDHVTIYLPTDQ